MLWGLADVLLFVGWMYLNIWLIGLFGAIVYTVAGMFMAAVGLPIWVRLPMLVWLWTILPKKGNWDRLVKAGQIGPPGP